MPPTASLKNMRSNGAARDMIFIPSQRTGGVNTTTRLGRRSAGRSARRARWMQPLGSAFHARDLRFTCSSTGSRQPETLGARTERQRESYLQRHSSNPKVTKCRHTGQGQSLRPEARSSVSAWLPRRASQNVLDPTHALHLRFHIFAGPSVYRSPRPNAG